MLITVGIRAISSGVKSAQLNVRKKRSCASGSYASSSSSSAIRSARMSSARLGPQPLEYALGDRGRVLEQAVDPRVVVGVEREGRGVDAAAAGRVGDHRAGRPVAARAALQACRGASPASRSRPAMRSRRCGSRSVFPTEDSLAVSLSIRPSTLAHVALAPRVVDGVIGAGDEPDRGDLAAAAAGAMAAGGGVVVVAVEHQALGVAVVVDRALRCIAPACWAGG